MGADVVASFATLLTVSAGLVSVTVGATLFAFRAFLATVAA